MVIKSVGSSDTEILSSILELHVEGDRFDVDPCYSKGNFYGELEEPKYKFDLYPQTEDTIQADSRNLPLPTKSADSIVFDPPFMFGNHGQQKNSHMTKRFSMFKSWDELESMYRGSLDEFHRILKPQGTLAFKCQDYTDSKTTMTHCHVWQWAEEANFYPKDLFILHWQAGRIYNPKLTQRHARKFHSYYWVFKRKGR